MAWTERYVRADADGAGNGTTDANSGANGSWTLAQAIAGAAAGQRLNVKAGTYANTTTNRTFGIAGTTTAPIWWRGFNTTIGDIDTDNELTKPVITFTTGRFFITASYQYFSNLNVSGAAVGAQFDIDTVNNICIIRCRIENTSANAASYAADTGGASRDFLFIDSWFKATTTADQVVRLRVASGIHGCAFEGGGHGILIAVGTGSVSPTVTIAFTTFKDQGGDAVRITTASSLVSVVNCSIYSPTSDGIEMTTVPNGMTVANCIFSECGGYGINNSSGANTANVVRTNNLFHSNTSGNENGLGDTPSLSQQTDSASPFTNASGNNLSVIFGSNAKAKGLPQRFENESYVSYLDIGAVQRQEGPLSLHKMNIGTH